MRILTIGLGCVLLAGCVSPRIPNSAAHVQPQAVEPATPVAMAPKPVPAPAPVTQVKPADIRQQEQMVRDAQLETQTVPRTTVRVAEPISAVPANVDNAVIMPPLPTTSATKPPAPKPVDPASGVAADTRAIFSPAPVATTTTATAATTVTESNAQVANAATVAPQPSAPAASAPAASSDIGKYAVANTHPVGTKKYARGGFLSRLMKTNKCDSYSSPNAAQSAFLAQGGPENDPLGLDPDGDGYACAWDPAPYRRAVNG